MTAAVREGDGFRFAPIEMAPLPPVEASQYGKGERGVVLAHGGRFNEESWAPQARRLSEAGFHVVAIDFRGYGLSRGPAML